MSVMYFVVAVFAVITYVDALNLPTYIKPCSSSDPKLNECALKNGREAIPSLIRGDNTYKIPNMQPLELPEINFSSGNLNIKLNNVKIYGLDDAQLSDIKIDEKRRHIEVKMDTARMNLLSLYKIAGRILILPITGSGNTNITFVDGIYIYSFDYILKEVHGEEYLSITSSKLTYDTKETHFHFDNLFNGDKILGDQTNKFLEENSKIVEQEIGPALTETVSDIIKLVLTGIFDKVPYNKLFLP